MSAKYPARERFRDAVDSYVEGEHLIELMDAAVAEARAPLVEALETGLFQLEIYPNHVYRELGKGRRGKRGWCDLCDALDDVRAALAAKETP